jgi:hypothetical protein
VDQRNRLLVIARTLRKFGLVDNFGLGEIVQRRTLPSRDAIMRLITESSNMLPPGISAKFLTGQIVNDLEVAERGNTNGEKLSELVAALHKIPKGKPAATRYQMAVLEIFRSLFEERLGTMKSEVTIFSGIKRVDITANNDLEKGFFAALRAQYGLYCPYIFFECKNYTEDPENPEFDQLLARLNPTSTQVGYVVCRGIKDAAKARQRCKEAFLREGRSKLMLWLTDADLSELTNALTKNGFTAVDALLKERLESITLK